MRGLCGTNKTVELIRRLCVVHRTDSPVPREIRVPSRDAEGGSAMPAGIISLLIIVAIFFLILYLIWLLPAPWRVRQIIQIIAVILGLIYLYQHQSLLHFW